MLQFNLRHVAIAVFVVAAFLAVARLGSVHLTGCAIGAACGAIAVGSVHRGPQTILGAVAGAILFWPAVLVLWLIAFHLCFGLGPGFTADVFD